MDSTCSKRTSQLVIFNSVSIENLVMLMTAETMLLLYNGQVDQYLSKVSRLTTDMYIKFSTNLYISSTVTLVHAPMLFAYEIFCPLKIKASA